MIEEKLYCVYTKRIAIMLRRKGFQIMKTSVNYKKPEFDVFYFLDTPELHEAIKTIQSTRF